MIPTNLWKYYIQAYVGEFPCYLIHEVSHWIVAFIFFLLGRNEFPTIILDRWFHVETVGESNQISSFNMHVDYMGDDDNIYSLLFITIAPAISTVLLFIFSPWWLNIYWICNMSTLWLSVKDHNDCKNLIKQIIS